MEPIKSEIEDRQAINNKFGIIQQYDDPDTYGPEESHFGDGKYPLDWDNRREAIWRLQDQLCGRCGQHHDDEGHVHHIHPLSKNGDNALDNLVGVCTHCHKLLHPGVTNLDGYSSKAPPYPSPRAEPSMKIITMDSKLYLNSLDLHEDFKRLEQQCDPDQTKHSVDSALVYNFDAATASKFAVPSDESWRDHRDNIQNTLEAELIKRNSFPNNEDYTPILVTIETPLEGDRAVWSDYNPDVSVNINAVSGDRPKSGQREQETEDPRTTEYKFTDDVEQVAVELVDGNGDTVEEIVEIPQAANTHTVSIPVEAPSSPDSYTESFLMRYGDHTVTKMFLKPFSYVAMQLGALGVIYAAAGTVLSLLYAIFYNGPMKYMLAHIGFIVVVIVLIHIIEPIYTFYGFSD